MKRKITKQTQRDTSLDRFERNTGVHSKTDCNFYDQNIAVVQETYSSSSRIISLSTLFT